MRRGVLRPEVGLGFDDETADARPVRKLVHQALAQKITRDLDGVAGIEGFFKPFSHADFLARLDRILKG